jgi:hypothetical protein
MKVGMALPTYGAAGFLLLLLVVEWLPSTDAPVPPPPQPAHTIHGATSEAESVAKDTAAWASAIIRRPLFAVNRRPPKTSGHNAQIAATGLPRLSGIMITQAGRRAIFMPETGKPITLGEGGSIDDYTIRRIAADRVVLSGAKGDMVLRPAYDAAHAGMTTTPIFGQPGYTPPGFPQPNFAPGFVQPPNVPPGFPAPQVPQPGNAAADDNNNDGQTPPPAPMQPRFPGIRGPFIPQGRN